MTGLSLKVEDENYINEPVSLISKSFARSNEVKGLRGHSDSNHHDHHMKDYVDDKKMIIYDKVSSEEERKLQDSISADMQGMLALVNQARSRAGKGPLCFNAKLNKAALAHSKDMADNNFFSHRGSRGTSVANRVSGVGYGWRGVAENIAYGSGYTASHNGLMNSSGHRRNILNSDFTQIGIGFATYTSGSRDGRTIITQVFGKPSSNNEKCKVRGSSCSDVRGWYDSDGKIYNCQWYSRNNRCQSYGNGYRNFGATANQACCVCGGGE